MRFIAMFIDDGHGDAFLGNCAHFRQRKHQT
jgi:hypothetical protein